MSVMQYRTSADLLLQAKTYLENGHGAVSIDEAMLDQVAASFKIPDSLPDWKDCLSSEAQAPYCIPRAAFELAMNASQNAGYTEPDGKGGVSKWEIRGSGASALKALFREMRDKQVLPGIHIDAQEVRGKIRPMLVGNLITPELKGRRVPFVDQRLAMFEEFASPAALQVFQQISQAATTANGYHFTFENTVLPLRKHFPKSFGDDPLCKKALLTPILLTANAQAYGVPVTTDVFLPADYRLPVTLNKLTILNLSPELLQVINNNEMLEQDDPSLLAIRGATLVACDGLRKKTGFQPQQLDAALWIAATPQTAPTQQPARFGERLLQRPPNSHGLWI